MEFYASPAAEAVAVRRAAARAACIVRGVKVDAAKIGAPVRVRSDIDCGDGWGGGRLLLALAVEDARTPGAHRLASELRASTAGDEDFARAVHAFVRERVRFERERVEEFETGGYTLELGAGDCDAHFRLVYAILEAGGLHSGLALLHHGDGSGPAHAVAVVQLGGVWTWVETTVAAHFGEPPNDAARRLHLTTDRTDIAKEVRIMTDHDLAPVPHGFREANDPAQVSLDAQALQRLGYLADDECAAAMSDPTAPVLRTAVLAFQVAQGIVADGLLGPTTRLTIAHVLEAAGPPVTQGFRYPGIGGLEEGTSLTSHLSAGFFRGVVQMVNRMRTGGATITPADMLAVWLAESGIRNIPNRQGYPYAGLNQMGPQERSNAGFHGSMADWIALSCEAQLPYVERYYVAATGGNFRNMRDAASLYLVNFLPAFIGHAGEPDFVLARIDPAGPSLSSPETEWEAWRNAKNPDTGRFLHRGDWYAANRGFDARHDGTIRVRDMGIAVGRAQHDAKGKVTPYWTEVLARLDAEGGSPAPASGSSIAALGIIAGMLAIGGWATYNAVRS